MAIPRRPRSVGEQVNDFYNILAYGKAGVGKTSLSLSCPKPVLILDCEQGISSVSRVDPKIAEDLGIELDKKGVPVDVYFETIKSLEDIQLQAKRVRDDNAASPGFWRTVVLDSLTELQRTLIGERLQASRRLMMEQADWGIITLQCEAAVRTLRSLPVNSLFIVQEKEDEKGVGPDLSGGISRAISRHIDVMCRYVLSEKEEEKEGKKIVKQTRALRMRRQVSPPVECKCRFYQVGDWEHPHVSRLIDKFKGDS